MFNVGTLRTPKYTHMLEDDVRARAVLAKVEWANPIHLYFHPIVGI